MQKIVNKEYMNYRWFFTSNNVLVIGGKSDEQNELVIDNFAKPNYIVMHTSIPGSSFMIIQSDNPNKKDLNETAIFTACFSQQWKKNSRIIDIDIFKAEQIYKLKSMKLGTFGVKGTKKTVKVKPELAIVIQKGKLRAVPSITKEKKLLMICPGNLTKEQAALEIQKKLRDKYHFLVIKEEIMQAIPSGNIGIK